MPLRKLVLALSAALLLPAIGHAQAMSVPGPHGTRLSVIADFPAGAGPHPAIVLAPGQGYDIGQPALQETARSLVASGVAVFRFDWAYATAVPQGRPSDDLARELEDLQAVVAAARSHPRVASKTVSVGGKSLGSIVAWRALAADASLRSGLLLTPVCSRLAKGETQPRSVARENYPGFETERRPTLSISGNRDPLCDTRVLYQFASTGSGAARVAVVGGDHSYEDRSLPPAQAEAARVGNIAAVAALAAGFVAEISGMPAGHTP